MYAVKEIFLTLQGEGVHTGRPAVFCRFAGCNLWSGREEDRAEAVCQFCDTDFVGTGGTKGGKYKDAEALADAIAGEWGAARENRFTVFTGGEPLLQVDEPLLAALHARGFEVAVETNGTLEPPAGSCTVETLGGTSGAVTSIRILPSSAGLSARAVGIWPAKGTARTTMAASMAADVLSFP